MLNYEAPSVTLNEILGLNEDVSVILNTIPGATIYYTLDGTTPTTGSLVYNGPISILESTTFQYMAALGVYYSPVYKKTYTINNPEPIIPDPIPNPTPTPGNIITGAVAGITGALLSIVNVITEPAATETAPNEIAPGLPANPSESDANSLLGIIIGLIILAVIGLVAYLGRGTIFAMLGRGKQ